MVFWFLVWLIITQAESGRGRPRCRRGCRWGWRRSQTGWRPGRRGSTLERPDWSPFKSWLASILLITMFEIQIWRFCWFPGCFRSHLVHFFVLSPSLAQPWFRLHNQAAHLVQHQLGAPEQNCKAPEVKCNAPQNKQKSTSWVHLKTKCKPPQNKQKSTSWVHLNKNVMHLKTKCKPPKNKQK